MGTATSGSMGTVGSGGGTTSPPIGSTIVAVTVEDQSGATSTRSNVPVTFAQPFIDGDVPAGTTLLARTKGGGASVDLQVDAKAFHADGSLRHAVFTAIVPTLPGGGSTTIELVSATPLAAQQPVAPSALLATPFDTTVSLALGGQTYTASARSLLQADSSHTWLSGPLATEWTLAAPVRDKNGVAHPHLEARFDVRAYAGAKTAVVSVTVENDWAFEPGPQNFTYDASVATDKGAVFSAPGLIHYRQARWRQTFNWGLDPQARVTHDPQYLIATRAVPNYDPAVTASDSALTAIDKAFSGKVAAPMGIGLPNPYMPTTGGRPDIGPLPQWTALYVISQDVRAERATLGTDNRAGSWGIHYRDKKTDLPVSLADYPYMTLLGNPGDAINPTTNMSEAFPACGGDCSTPYRADSSHQPSFAYVPYLLTGDHYYLEELQFWANVNMLESNPGYRDHEKGLLHATSVRGQAWSLRTLGAAAYITPDAHPLKKYFVDRVGYNLDWYNQNYANEPSANTVGYLDGDGAIGTDGTIAPWMDDFFTWSTGFLADLGFDQAKPIRDWKARYPAGRMTDATYCWIFGAIYHMRVQDPATMAFYPTLGQMFAPSLAAGNYPPGVDMMPCGGAAMASALMLMPGEMTGYSDGAEGFPSNMQPALAIAADSNIPNGKAAWTKFMARSVKPGDYDAQPQFDIVPR